MTELNRVRSSSSKTAIRLTLGGSNSQTMSCVELLQIVFFPFYDNLVEAETCVVCARAPAHVYTHAAMWVFPSDNPAPKSDRLKICQRTGCIKVATFGPPRAGSVAERCEHHKPRDWWRVVESLRPASGRVRPVPIVAVEGEYIPPTTPPSPDEVKFAKLLAKYTAAKRYMSERLQDIVSLYYSVSAVEVLFHLRFALDVVWPEILCVRGWWWSKELDNEMREASQLDYVVQLLVHHLRTGQKRLLLGALGAVETLKFISCQEHDVFNSTLDTRGQLVRSFALDITPICGIQFLDIEPEVV